MCGNLWFAKIRSAYPKNLRFQILYLFVILNHSRRQVLHFAVTAHPTIAWVIQQLREGMPFGQQPTYLFRDNDGIYGDELGRFLAGTGIKEVKTAHQCPWQNPFVERYGGPTARAAGSRDCP